MLAIAIILLVAAGGLAFLGGFAAGMSDAPGQSSGVAGPVVCLLIASGVFFVLWASGYHLNLITRS